MLTQYHVEKIVSSRLDIKSEMKNSLNQLGNGTFSCHSTEQKFLCVNDELVKALAKSTTKNSRLKLLLAYSFKQINLHMK